MLKIYIANIQKYRISKSLTRRFHVATNTPTTHNKTNCSTLSLMIQIIAIYYSHCKTKSQKKKETTYTSD